MADKSESEVRNSAVFNEASVRLRPKRRPGVNSVVEFPELREQLQQERLAAYREDLAEWLAGLFHMNISADTLMTDLENGTILCQLAAIIERGEKDGSHALLGSLARQKLRRSGYTPAPTSYQRRAAQGSFHARDNVARFIDWLKGVGVADSILFEASDLVDHKNEKNVLYSLMELGRNQYGVDPPMLVEIERNIDRMGSSFKLSEEEELGLEHDIGVVLKKMKKEYLVPERIGPGEYKFGHLGPFKVVKLRRHVMVRLPNTWDTLDHVLHVYDTAPAPRARRRSSLVLDVVEDKERELSVAAALSQRRLSRRSSASEMNDSFRRRAVSTHASIEEEGDGVGGEGLRTRMAEMETELSRSNAELKDLVEDRQKLQKLYDEEKMRTNELEAELEDAAAQQKERSSLDAEVASLRDMNNDLKRKVSDLSDAVQASEYFKTEMERLRGEVKRLSEEHARELESTAAKAASAAKQEQEHSKKIAALEEGLIVAKQSADAERLEMEKLREYYEGKLTEASGNTDKYTQQLEEEHEKEVQELEEELAQLRAGSDQAAAATAAERENAQRRLQQQQEQFAKDKAALETQLQGLQDEMGQVRAEAETSAKRAAEDREQREKELREEHSAERERLQAQLDAVKRDAEEKTAAAQEAKHSVEKRAEGLRAQLQEDKDARERLQMELEALRAEMEALKKQHAAELEAVREEAAKHLEERLAEARAHAGEQRKALEQQHAQELEVAHAQASDHSQAVTSLQEQLDATNKAKREAEARADELDQDQQALQETLTMRTQEVHAAQETAAGHEREARDKAAELEALQAKVAEAEAAEQRQRQQMDGLSSQLSAAEDRARTAELQATQAAAAAEARVKELDALRSSHREELARLRTSLTEDTDQRVSALKTQLEEARAAVAEEKERVAAANKERAAAEHALAEEQLSSQGLKSNVEFLELQQREKGDQVEAEKATLQARVKDLEQQLLEQERAAQEKLETAETHLRSTLDAERDHHDQEMARLRKQLEEARTEADATRAAVENETAGKLEEAQRKLESVETLAASRKERFDNEIKLLRLRCMEAERKESSSRLERDMLSQKMTALQTRKEELGAELDSARSSNRLKLEEMQKRLVQAEAEAQSRERERSAAPPRYRRFCDMALDRLQPEDVDLICVRDEEARAANLGRLQARMELEEADKRLEEAAQEDAEQQTPGTREELEQARQRKQRAQSRLQQAEIAFHAAAERAVGRLRDEEKQQEEEGQAGAGGTAEDMLLRAHADAQMEIARLERELSSGWRRAEDEAAEQIMGLRVEHSSKIKELSDQRAEDQRRLAELQSLVNRMRSQLGEMDAGAADGASSSTAAGHELTAKERRLFEAVAEWINLLLETDLKWDTLIDGLRDGKVLCQLANIVDEVEEKLREMEAQQGPSDERVITRECQDITAFIRERELLEVQYLEEAEPGNEAALSNVRAFIEWAQCLGIKYPSVFEEEDLLHDEDHRQVVNGILDVAYRVRGLPLPAEVEDHRATAEPIQLPAQQEPSYTHVQGDDVDERVAEVLNFVPQMKTKLKRVAKGKYQLGNEKRLLLMRVLRDNVMVRVGGGWMDLREYLVKHAQRSHGTTDYGEEAQATVQNILKSTGGPGLCSTRTKVPQRSPRHRKGRDGRGGRGAKGTRASSSGSAGDDSSRLVHHHNFRSK